MNNYFSQNQQQRLNQLENQYPNPLLNFQTMYQPSNNNMNVIYSMVSGLESVKAFSLPPGKTGLLFDNTKDEFYLKTVDSMGMQNIRKFTFQEVTLPSSNGSAIATDSNFMKRIENIEVILQTLLAQSGKVEIPKVEKQNIKKDTKEKTLFDEEIKK